MLSLGPGVQIVLATAPVDLRRGHDGLVALVQSLWKADQRALPHSMTTCDLRGVAALRKLFDPLSPPLFSVPRHAGT